MYGKHFTHVLRTHARTLIFFYFFYHDLSLLNTYSKAFTHDFQIRLIYESSKLASLLKLIHEL